MKDKIGLLDAEKLCSLLVKVVDEMFEGFQVVDESGRYVYVNESAASQGKSTPEELIGKKMVDVYPGIDQTEMYKRMQNTLKTGKRDEMLNKFVFPDKTVGWFRLMFEPIDAGVLILSIDVSELKRNERELEKKKQELEHTLELLIGRDTTMSEVKAELKRILEKSET